VFTSGVRALIFCISSSSTTGAASYWKGRYRRTSGGPFFPFHACASSALLPATHALVRTTESTSSGMFAAARRFQILQPIGRYDPGEGTATNWAADPSLTCGCLCQTALRIHFLGTAYRLTPETCQPLPMRPSWMDRRLLPGGKVLYVVDTLDPPAARHTDLGCWHCAWATKALTTHQMLSTSQRLVPLSPSHTVLG